MQKDLIANPSPNDMLDNMSSFLERMEKSRKLIENYNSVPAGHLTLPQTLAPPVFQNPEILELYNMPLKASPELMDHVLSLPRETLIADLQEVLLDSVRRFKYFVAHDDDNPDNRNAPIHALVLLGYIGDKRALPVALEILRQGKDYTEYWFGDWLTEDLWETYFNMFDAEAFVSFLKEPRLDTYSRCPVLTALEQKRLHGYMTATEAVSIYSTLLKHFIEHRDDRDYTDMELTGFLICDMMGPDMREMLSLIKECFDYGIVDEMMGGDYDDILKDFDTVFPYRKHELKFNQPIRQYYEDLILYNEPIEPLYKPVQEKKEKIGCNDACPCGSGKKYKKCCIDIL